jgi:hypothetical protein
MTELGRWRVLRPRRLCPVSSVKTRIFTPFLFFSFLFLSGYFCRVPFSSGSLSFRRPMHACCPRGPEASETTHPEQKKARVVRSGTARVSVWPSVMHVTGPPSHMDSDDPAQSTIDPALLAKLPPELNNAIKTFTFLSQMQDVFSTTDLEMIAKRVCNYHHRLSKYFDMKTRVCWINALVSGLDSFPIQDHSTLYLSLMLVYAYQIHLCPLDGSMLGTRNIQAGLPSTVQP